MKRITHYIVLCTLSLCTFSCRPQSDELLSYGQNDYQAYYDANHSFAGEFKAFWTAMNENYCIWDYEQSFGMDWDEVYATYLPKFEELDKRQDKVSDEELKALYSQFTDSLHDGHMVLTVKNRHTGTFIMLQPQQNRIMRERQADFIEGMQNVTTLDAYRLPTMESRYQIKAYDATGSDDVLFEFIDSTLQRAVRAAQAYIAMVDAAGGPDATNDLVYEGADSLKNISSTLLLSLQTPAGVRALLKGMIINGYNKICTQYAFVGQQIGVALNPIDSDLANDNLGSIRFALFEGNIAYLRWGGFGWSKHLIPEMRTKDSTTLYFTYQQAVNRVWHHWFDTIQVLHKNKQLGGVIFDVRNNTGGMLHDYQFVLGALLPSGGYDSHMMRIKNGTGRLDFAPLQPFTGPTYADEHEVVNDRPIVVLANCYSISMAEMTTYGVKSQPNGHFIGVRTYGALSALSADPESYSDMYSGAFGVQNVTPIWGYVPKLVGLFGPERQILEGVGITPDEEVHLDVNKWNTQQRDNQLEAAVDYIHSK